MIDYGSNASNTATYTGRCSECDTPVAFIAYDAAGQVSRLQPCGHIVAINYTTNA